MSNKEQMQLIAQTIMECSKEELVTIREVITLREQYLAKILKRQLQVGDEVNVHSDKVGEHGIVREIKRTKAIVEIDGKRWNCPIKMLTLKQ